MADMTQEEALAAQKANCPFCKIISGEIPSKKVYEDDQMIAILDINPANKGHLLVMPKEHYFILPLVPPATFGHMFLQAQKLMKAMRKGLIVPRVTLFIANGGAAGQQSPHFLFHLIPREGEGRLSQLDVQECHVTQENKQSIMQNTNMIMRNLPIQKPVAPPAPVSQSAPPVSEPTRSVPPTVAPVSEPTQTTPQPTPVASPQQPADVHPTIPVAQVATPPEISSSTPREVEDTTQGIIEEPTSQDRLSALLEMLKQEPGLHEMILKDPDKIVEYAKGNPLLQQAFEGIDIQQLSAILKEKEQAPPEPVEQVPHAKDLTDEQLRAFVEAKPELKRLLAEDLKGLHKMIHSNPRLKHFFKHSSPEEVATRLEQDEEIDFDLLARHLQ